MLVHSSLMYVVSVEILEKIWLHTDMLVGKRRNILIASSDNWLFFITALKLDKWQYLIGLLERAI